MHTHPNQRCIPLHHGVVAALRVDHHPVKDGTADDLGVCGICGEMVWLPIRTRRFQAMNPQMPTLCCLCSEFSAAALQQALPGIEIMAADIPDLARLGTFN